MFLRFQMAIMVWLIFCGGILTFSQTVDTVCTANLASGLLKANSDSLKNTLLTHLLDSLTKDADPEKYEDPVLSLGVDRPVSFYFSTPYKGIEEPPHPQFEMSPSFKIKITQKASLHLNYFGTYGFYAGKWESGPVVSRIQNPSIEFKYKVLGSNPRVKTGIKIALKGSIFAHESNGMHISRKSQADSLQTFFDSSGLKHFDSRAFSSMGWNYNLFQISAENIQFCDFSKIKYALMAEYRMYYDQNSYFHLWNPPYKNLEDEVFYDSKYSNAHFYYYDGFRVAPRISMKLCSFSTLTVYDRLRFGIPDPNGDWHFSNYLEWSVSLGGNAFKPRIFLSWEDGYGKDLATYPYKYSRLNVGIQGWH
jgi:hypothetical protein